MQSQHARASITMGPGWAVAAAGLFVSAISAVALLGFNAIAEGQRALIDAAGDKADTARAEVSSSKQEIEAVKAENRALRDRIGLVEAWQFRAKLDAAKAEKEKSDAERSSGGNHHQRRADRP